MKKIFTKIICVIATLLLVAGLSAPAFAQYGLNTVTPDAGVSAIARDASGNTYVIENPGSFDAGKTPMTDGEIVRYTNGTGTGKVVYSGAYIADNDYLQTDGYAFGIVVDASKNIYFCTDAGQSFAYGAIIKLTYNAGTDTYSDGGTPYIDYTSQGGSIGYPAGLALDASNHLFVLLYNANDNDPTFGAYTVSRYVLGTTTGTNRTEIYAGFELKPTYTQHNSSICAIAVDPAGNVYAADWFDTSTESYAGFIEKLTYDSIHDTYGASTLYNNFAYCQALGCDASGNLYANIGSGSVQAGTVKVVEFTGGSGSPTTLYSSLNGEFDYWCFGMAIIGSNIFTSEGNQGTSSQGYYIELLGPVISTTGTPSALSTITGNASSSTSFNVSGAHLLTNVTATAPSGFDISLNNSTWSGSGGSVTLTESSNTISSTPVYIRLDAGDAVNSYSGNVSFTATNATTVNVAIPSSTVSAQPIISAPGGTVTVPSTPETLAGTSTSFNISGSNLVGNITVTAPTNFQVSNNNSTWGSTATITASGTLSSTPVYVRLSGTGSVGAQSGNVQLTSTSATTVNQAVSGTLTQPTIAAPGGTTTLTSTVSGTPGPSTSFNISGSNLLGNITATAPTNMQVSADNSTWGSTATITVSGQTLSSTPVYVRLSGTGTVGTISGSVALSSTSATTVNQAVSGALNAPAVATSTSLVSNNNPSFNASPGNSVTFTATVTHSGTPVSESTVSFTSNGVAISGGSNVALNGSGQAAVTTSFSSTGSNAILATFNADANFLTSTSSSLPQQVNVHPPAIASTGTPAALSTTVGAASPSTSFNVSGAFMTAGILVSPPTGFEVSTDNSTFASTVTVGAAGTIASTPIYIRLAASDAVGTYSGNIVLSSSGATAVNVATLNSGVFTPPGNALAFDGVDDGVSMGTPPATVSGSFTVEAWVMPADGTKDMHVFSTRSTGNESFDIQITGGNTIHGDIGTGSAWLITAANAAFSYHAGQWIHIAYVVTTAGYSIYANGNLVGSGTFSGTPLLLDNTHVTTIGFDPGEATYFNGSIDEVRVYKAALSQANIQADMLSTASSSPLNLVNYYNFDNGAAGGTNTGVTTLTDKTATAYNGTLSNFALSGATSNWMESYAMVVPAATAASGVSTNGFTANWTAPITGTVTNYFVDVSTSSAFTSVISGSPFSTTSTSQAISGLTAGTYYYRVRANKTSVTGEGDYSAIITATVPVAISSLSIAGSSPTNAASVNYTATFGSAITGLTAGNFLITASGVTGALIGTPTTGDGGITWTVPVSTGTGDGTIQLILENATGISPAISTSLPFPGQIYTIDKTAPTVLSLSRADPNPTNETQLDYQITFSEPVTGVDNTDFTAVTSGVSAGAISVTPQSSTVYNISIASVNGTGTLQLNLNNSGTGIIDVAGNGISGGFSGDTYNVDQTAPFVSSITATTPGNANPTNATSVTYTVTFSEPVTGVSNLGFMATTTNTVASSSITVTPVSSSVYTATVNGISGDGTLRLDLNNGNTGIFDLAGNPLSGGFTGDVYTIDHTAPGVVFANYGSNNSNSISWAKVGDIIALDAEYNETVQTPVVTIGGHSVTPVFGLNTWASNYTLTPADIEGPIAFDIQATDLAGNTTETSSTSTGKFITFDMTPPTAMISAPSVAVIGTGGAGTVTYTVTYADANFNTSNLTNSGITLTATGTAAGTYNVTGSGTSYTVTISSITGLGTLSITAGAGNASDLAGNTDLGAGPSTPFNVVSTDATLSNLALSVGGRLTPAFSPGTTSYTRNVVNGVSSITVTPTANDPNATILVNGTDVVTSGGTSDPIALNAGPNPITVKVTAEDGSTTQTYTVTVTRAGASIDGLSRLALSAGIKDPVFMTSVTSYTANVATGVSSTIVTPTTVDPNSTVTVDGTTVTSGTPSAPIPLNIGPNTITITVTAQNGSTTKTYTVIVTRAGSTVTNLTLLKFNPGIKMPTFTSPVTSYTASVVNGVSSTIETPTASDPNATITVNNVAVASGSPSGVIPLNVGPNVITTVVTASDGLTKKTYTVTITRAPSTIVGLSLLKLSAGTKSPVFTSTNTSYTDSVSNGVSTITVTPTAIDPNATILVNGTDTVASGGTSDPIALVVGSNAITVQVTAQDGTSSKTYTVTVTRAAPPSANTVYVPISVDKPTETPALADDGIQVHQGVSPNGDGINDFLQIDNISQYPNNKLSIMNRNGQLVYEANGYDNSSKVFDGHSNKNGQMQLPGTYFYQLDYTVSGIAKHKTGFIILKY